LECLRLDAQTAIRETFQYFCFKSLILIDLVVFAHGWRDVSRDPNTIWFGCEHARKTASSCALLAVSGFNTRRRQTRG